MPLVFSWVGFPNWMRVSVPAFTLNFFADKLIMNKADFDSQSLLVNKATEEMALALLSLEKPAFIFPVKNYEQGYYMPKHISTTKEVDALTLLSYNRSYGLTKAKAIIKPWISNFVHHFDSIDALGLFHNEIGKAYLMAFDRVDVESIQSQQIVVYNDSSKNLILYRPSS